MYDPVPHWVMNGVLGNGVCGLPSIDGFHCPHPRMLDAATAPIRRVAADVDDHRAGRGALQSMPVVRWICARQDHREEDCQRQEMLASSQESRVRQIAGGSLHKDQCHRWWKVVPLLATSRVPKVREQPDHSRARTTVVVLCVHLDRCHHDIVVDSGRYSDSTRPTGVRANWVRSLGRRASSSEVETQWPPAQEEHRGHALGP